MDFWKYFEFREYSFEFLITFGSLAFWSIVEFIKPYKKIRFFRKGYLQDVGYLVISDFVFPILRFVIPINLFILFKDHSPFFLNINRFHVAIQVVVVVLCLDLARYLFHRLCHTNDFFWSLHRLHHSATEITALTAYRGHFLEDIFSDIIYTCVLVFLNANIGVVIFYSWLYSVHGHLHHANINFNPKYFRTIFSTPVYHKAHHIIRFCVDGVHGQNFGCIFSFWDRIFKTQYLGNIYSESYGYLNQDKSPNSFWYHLAYPFIKIKNKIYAIPNEN
jgi:sterol desaturase/sphingolipid hydroxylase (fatty acid hydroxylase superfamily)